jgi:hypothetical protein
VPKQAANPAVPFRLSASDFSLSAFQRFGLFLHFSFLLSDFPPALGSLLESVKSDTGMTSARNLARGGLNFVVTLMTHKDVRS